MTLCCTTAPQSSWIHYHLEKPEPTESMYQIGVHTRLFYFVEDKKLKQEKLCCIWLQCQIVLGWYCIGGGGGKEIPASKMKAKLFHYKMQVICTGCTLCLIILLDVETYCPVLTAYDHKLIHWSHAQTSELIQIKANAWNLFTFLLLMFFFLSCCLQDSHLLLSRSQL